MYTHLVYVYVYIMLVYLKLYISLSTVWKRCMKGYERPMTPHDTKKHAALSVPYFLVVTRGRAKHAKQQALETWPILRKILQVNKQLLLKATATNSDLLQKSKIYMTHEAFIYLFRSVAQWKTDVPN